MSQNLGKVAPYVGGRMKGVQNRVGAEAKQMIKDFIEKRISTGELDIWLDRVAVSSPDKALRIIVAMMEYVIPKLARLDGEIKENRVTVLLDIPTKPLPKTVSMSDAEPPEIVEPIPIPESISLQTPNGHSENSAVVGSNQATGQTN